MSYFEFPHTRSYYGDLGYIIKRLNELTEKYGEFMEYNQIRFADPVEWNINKVYSAWEIVFANNGYYIAVKPVPAGIMYNNADYWQLIIPFDVDTVLDTESLNPVANSPVARRFNQVSNSISNVVSSLQNEGRQREEADEAIITRVAALEEDTEHLSGALNTERDERETADTAFSRDIDALTTRVDNLSQTIVPGGTTGDAELADIRLGANGVTYPNAGDSVRSQFEEVNQYTSGLNATLTNTGSEGYHKLNCLLISGKQYKFTNNDTTHAMAYYLYKADNTYTAIDTCPAGGYQYFAVPNGAYVAIGAYMVNGASFTIQSVFSDLGELNSINNIIDCDLLKGATWETGGYVSVATYSNTSVNSTKTRIRTQITLAATRDVVNMKRLNENYSYEFGLYDSDGNTLMYKSGWQSQDWNYTGGGVKYIRVNVRRNDNAHINTGEKHGVGAYENNMVNMSNVVYNTSRLMDKVALIKNNTRLSIMSHNCGHFNYGRSSEYPGPDTTAKITEWKQMIARTAPDIVFAQECSQYFDAAQTYNAYNTLYEPLLPYNTSNYYGLGRIFSKIPLSNARDIDISVTVGSETYSRSTRVAEINIDGVKIAVCALHLSPGYSEDDETARAAQRDLVIAALADYDHVIIGGDFNSSQDSFYESFTTAGYNVANHGYFGTITTLPNESVDNIIVKGFVFYNAESDPDNVCTSDHYPITGNIRLI